MQQVAALYVRPDSVYQQMPGVICWDRQMDARHYPGPHPVVAHPPCARWGRYAKVGGREIGHDQGCGAAAVAAVRRWGGVLEHPKDSRLWAWMLMPKPSEGRDCWGGRTVLINQIDYGHRAIKPTWIYIVGEPNLGLSPLGQRETAAVGIERLSKKTREMTPYPLATQLVELARKAARRRAS